MNSKELQRMTWQEAERELGSDPSVALVPVGATEQHGHHLPLGTDTIMVEEVCRRIATRVEGVFVAPAIPYGTSHNHSHFLGTVNLSLDTLKRVLVEVGHDLTRQGADIVVLVNGHGGNVQAVAAAAYDLRLAAPTAVIAQVMWPTVVKHAWGVLDHGISWHADESETSLMLYLAPDAVAMDRAVDEPPRSLPFFEFTEASLAGTKVDLGLPRTDAISASGTIGYATAATAEKGQAIVDEAIDELAATVATLREKHRELAPALARSGPATGTER